MPARGADGRFFREEGLNINISIFIIIKYLLFLLLYFPGSNSRKNRNSKNI